MTKYDNFLEKPVWNIVYRKSHHISWDKIDLRSISCFSNITDILRTVKNFKRIQKMF